MAAVPAGALPRPSVPARLGLLHTTRLFTYPYGTGAPNYTYLQQTGSEAPFDWVRLVYMNNTPDQYQVGAASVAASAHAPSDGYSAYRADGSANTFTPVLFNAAGANGGLPPPSAGAATQLTVPGRIAADVPSLAFSDWVQLPSIAPDDGGTFHHLLVRTYVLSGSPSMPVSTPTANVATAFPTIAAGRNLKAYHIAGNVTAATGALSPSGPGQYVNPVAVQFTSRRRGLTIVGLGDSIDQGAMSTSGHNGAGWQAAKALSTPAFPMFFCNHGYIGQATGLILLNGRNAIDAYTPDVAIVPVFSPNDGTPSQASCEQGLARALNLAQYCVGKGVVPILRTGIPIGSLTTATDAFRRSVNDRACALSPGLLVADYDAAVSNGANPARIKPAYDPGDGIHLNDAGYAACADMLRPILSRIAASARAS